MKKCSFSKQSGMSDTVKADLTFSPLTPTDEAKDCESYMGALSWALNQDKIHNIAISGPYGSGKSSVIRTFLSSRGQCPKYKHLTISLATFNAQKVGDTPEMQSRLIESSILEQLFYHEEDSHIPDSRFKKIRKQHRGKLFVYALASVIFSLLLIFLFRPSLLSTWLTGTTIPDNGLIWFNRVALGLCIIGAVYILYKLARIVIGLSVKRLNFKSAEVEIENNTQKSVLNSHIDEIIYFFEVTEYQIVVLEDLDRFDNHDIFIKLREINYIINNSDKVKQKVVFIYAIKDDMFVDSKDRTKFFDFIIPIIPVVNYSNSGEILRRELKVSDNTPKNDSTVIHEAIIDQLSLFIDDLRLLYNIINEYKIYRNRLSSSQKSDEHSNVLHLIADRLLAIIIYKNLYPQDFSDLAIGKGLLYSIISSKKDPYINAAIDKCIKDIAEKEKRVETIETADRPFSAAELRLIYAQKIADELHPNVIYFVINKQRKTISECAQNEELFNILISNNRIDFYYLHPNYRSEQSGSSAFNFHALEKKVHDLTYQQRLDLLYKTELEELKSQIRALKRNIDEYKQYTIDELMREDKYSIDSKLTKGYPQQQIDFLNIVLREGYINENYWEYISVFYPGSLTYEDKQFVLDVFAGRSNSYDYHLNLVENVLKKLTKESTKYLSSKASLNFDIMDYIAPNGTIAYIEPYMLQMSSHPDFVVQYIKRGGKALGDFMNLLCAYWPNFWLYVLSELEKDKDYYLNLIIKHALDEYIIPIFQDKKQYLEEYADFLLVDTESEKLHSLISEMDLRFKNLNPETDKTELEYIYSQGYYQDNLQMLHVLLCKQDKWDESAFMARNYDYICDNFDLMSEHIHHDLSKYIDNVFLALDSQQTIDSAHLVELLNNETLSIEKKKQIINKSECKVENIAEIKETKLQNEVCKQNKMSATWENIRTMMNEDEDSENACVEFINIIENAQQLSSKAPQKEEQTPDDDNLFYVLICRNDINDEAYTLLVPHANFNCPDFEEDEISENHMRILIDHNIVTPSGEGFRYLKEKHPNLCISLLENTAKDHEWKYSECQFDAEDIMRIVQSVNLDDETKREMINSISSIDVMAENIESIKSVVQWLLSNERNEDAALKKEIMNYLVQQQSIDVSDRKHLFIKYANVIKDIEPFLKSLGEPFSNIAERKEITYIPVEDKKLLDTLKRVGYITKYLFVPGNKMYYVRNEFIK